MKKKILLLALISSLLISTNSHAFLGLGFAKKHPIATAVVGAGVVIWMNSAARTANHLSKHPDEADGFFNKHPEKYAGVSKYLSAKLNSTRNIEQYDAFKKLAEVMNVQSIPPFNGTADNGPVIHDNPEDSTDEDSGLYINPVDTEDHPTIIVTPTGEEIDVSTEFPNEEIKTWDEYLLLKSQSDLLTENMIKAGLGKKPEGYEAHHIVAYSYKKHEIVQKLRDLLKANNIGLNDADNGVYLPAYERKTKGNGEAYHKSIHTTDYFIGLAERLIPLDGDEAAIRNELNEVSRLLKINKLKY